MDSFKKCKKCKCVKSTELFYNKKRSKDGLMSICKICNSENNKLRYSKNRDLCIIQSKKWRDDNIERHRANAKAWAEANPERVKENKKRAMEKNPELYKNLSKKYREANEEKQKQYMKNYYNENSEKYKAERKEYYKNNTEKVKSESKAWMKNNPDKYNAIKSRRRARKLNQMHPDHDSEIEKFLYRESRRLESINEIGYNVDHIWPLSIGGPHHHDNLQVIAKSLNQAKKDNIMFSHPDIKTWIDLPSHILEWIKVNQNEYFENVLSKIKKSGNYTSEEILILESI